MWDTSSSSCSESEDEGVEESSSSQKLQETPSLARVKKDALSLEEGDEAARISDVAVGLESWRGECGVIDRAPGLGKTRTREWFGASARGNRESARIERINVEKEVARKQIQKQAKKLGSRKNFKRAILITSTSSESEEDEEEVQKRCSSRVVKRWNISSSDEEENPIKQAEGSRPNDENNSMEETNLHTTSNKVGVQEVLAGEETLRENTPPSSSLGPSPPNSPAAEPYVQKALNNIRQRRKDILEEKKRKEKMMDEISLRLFEERGKRCREENKEGEKELLRMAAHVFKCKGCSNTRYTVTMFMTTTFIVFFNA